ncbi:hypothetical protein [Pseudomonas sp. PS01301]|uniref:hypothetical protein n=1 Tax=Pseudomonas sp. PS01301 TaxID=2991437 RepID=UPI00249A4FDA|nr:hypothetical protein [Pseudomonas sp. PS01301]
MSLMNTNTPGWMSKGGFAALIVLIFLVGGVHTYWYRDFQPDDTFIYLVYVKSYLQGNGLTFNGQLVEGYSSVLWTLLVTLLAAAGVDALWGSKLLGWLAYAGIGTFLLSAHRAAGANRASALCALAIFFSVPSLAMWASGAMETVLFSAIICAAVLTYYQARMGVRHHFYYVASGVLFGLLSICRPEGFALIGAVFAFEAILVLHKKKSSLQGVITTVGIYAVMTASMFAIRWSIYGKLFPATVGAKTGSLSVQMYHGQQYLIGFFQSYSFFVLAYASLLLFGLFSLRKKNDSKYFLLWLSTILVAGYTLFNFLVGGDWMLGWRFVTPIIPFIVLTIGICLSALNSKVASIITLLIMANLIGFSSKLHERAMLQAASDRGDILMGQYIKSLDLPHDAKIAVIDAGAIPYYAELYTIDMIGLNDSYLSGLPGGFLQKYDNSYVLANKPAVIQFHTRALDDSHYVVPTEAFIGATKLFYSAEFQRWYVNDTKSPVPHLFRRLTVPKENTFIEDFMSADFSAAVNGSRVTLKATKKGEGVWVAPTGTHTEAGAVYIRVHVKAKDSQFEEDKLLPIPKNLRIGESLTVEFDMPREAISGLELISACPILAGVDELTACTTGEAGNLLTTHQKTKGAPGIFRFDDPLLSLRGWSGFETDHVWSLGETSTIDFQLSENAGIRVVSLKLMPFGDQPLEILLNGDMLFKGKITDTREIALSPGKILPENNSILIRHPGAVAPGAGDARTIAVALVSITLQP